MSFLRSVLTNVCCWSAELTTSKKPALSSTFSAHVNTSSLQRKLLDAQSQVTTLQNDLLQRLADIDRLEADRRLLATQVDEQTKGREKVTTELAKLRVRMSYLVIVMMLIANRNRTLLHYQICNPDLLTWKQLMTISPRRTTLLNTQTSV